MGKWVRCASKWKTSRQAKRHAGKTQSGSGRQANKRKKETSDTRAPITMTLAEGYRRGEALVSLSVAVAVQVRHRCLLLKYGKCALWQRITDKETIFSPPLFRSMTNVNNQPRMTGQHGVECWCVFVGGKAKSSSPLYGAVKERPREDDTHSDSGNLSISCHRLSLLW